MTTCVYEFQIPDLSRPVAGAGPLSPSGELVAFHPPPLHAAGIVGRRIDELTPRAGTYGMGGPGFFALRLGADWLIVALWGAASWMTCKDRLIEDMFHDTENRSAPWIDDARDELSPVLVGQAITAIDVQRASLRISFAGGHDLTISADPATRPAFAGNGQRRAFASDDDLRRAVFLSPTTELWV